MKKTTLLILLLLSPALCQDCFIIDLELPTGNQGLQTFKIRINNTSDDPLRIKTIEARLSEPQNFSKYENYTCFEWVGDKCKSIIWKENLDILPDAEHEREFYIDLCLAEKEYLTIQASATADCPQPYFILTNDTKTYTAVNGVNCSDVQQYQGGIFENVTLESYYKSYGGEANLTINASGYSENVTYYDPQCKSNPCSAYKTFEKNMTSRPYAIRICANATDSEVRFRDIQTRWRFITTRPWSNWDNESIQVTGRSEIDLIYTYPQTLIERESYNITARVKNLCGYSEQTRVFASVDNSSRLYFTQAENLFYKISNEDQKYASFAFITNYSGSVNFTIKSVVGDIADTAYYYVEILEKPCAENYTYCGNKCKPDPENCTQHCATGATFCKGEDVVCELFPCGSACPLEDRETQLCDATGICRPVGREGWYCNCDNLCNSTYTEGSTCYYSPVCSGLKCEYKSSPCPATATCTSWGCCGDGICETTETCFTCAPDCGCDDGNACTQDICSGSCIHTPQPCGWNCPDGGCDGEGNCVPDACCRPEDCMINPCRTGPCVNHTCQFTNYSCTDCQDGFCLNGTCYHFQTSGEDCPCPNSCTNPLACYQGKCSTCGNGNCDKGECTLCPEDCPEGFCPKGSFLGSVLIVAVIGVLTIAGLAYFKIL